MATGELLKLLLAGDDADHCEAPPDFDWERERERVERLKPALDVIVGREFELEDRIQDAAFFAELSILSERPRFDRRLGTNVIDTVLGVRFSCFGHFFTVFSTAEADKIGDAEVEAVIAHIRYKGFVFVDPVTLELPYTGNNAGVRGTWWGRYFEYL